MSYDLAVYLGREVEEAAWFGWKAELPLLASTDGPFQVEDDDLPDAVVPAGIALRWLVELSLPAAGANVHRTQLVRAARHLADRTDGVVYDPQADAVVHPRSSRRRLPPRTDRRLDVIDIEWYIRREDLPPDAPRRLLEAFRRRLPEALPSRYGHFEPFQGRFGEAGPEGFAAAWHKDDLYWSNPRPCLGGGTAFVMEGRTWPQRVTRPVGSVSLQIERAPADADPRWADLIVELIADAATRLGAFHAKAEVIRGVLISSRGTSYDNRSETTASLCPQTVWKGLSRLPPWVAWFGPAYAELVAQHLPLIEVRGGGRVYRTSTHPTDRDFAGLTVPEDLVAPPGTGPTSARRIPAHLRPSR